MVHNCTICGKEFSAKSGLEKHKERKIPCSSPTVLIQQVLGIPTEEFRPSSKKFNTTITKEERNDNGIYFTPKKVRERLFEICAKLNIEPITILEPSFGTGEFILDAKRIYPKAIIEGVEKNKQLFESLKSDDKLSLYCSDFLDWNNETKYNLIIGNPPYFTLKTKDKYKECMSGRPNIYILFLYKCLKEHLLNDGYLAFIIPTSLYNCSYYQPMRNYIKKNTTILHLETLEKPGFYQTTQETMLIVLQKKESSIHPYIFENRKNTYISPYYKELKDIIKGTTNISSLGLGVKTGNIVWNQVKEDLTNTSENNQLLIYSSNIKDCRLDIESVLGGEKKQYIKKDSITKKTINGPVILVDRGYGNSFRFNFILVKEKNFYAENHINVIYPLKEDTETINNLEIVINSFQNENTMKFMKWFVGNGSVSATELENSIPIFK